MKRFKEAFKKLPAIKQASVLADSTVRDGAKKTGAFGLM